MEYSRREFGRLALAGVPATAFWLKSDSTLAAASKPNSKWAGVQVGMNVPYNFGGRDMNADELLDRILKLDVNAVEMRSQPVESFLGSPAADGRKADADAMRSCPRVSKNGRSSVIQSAGSPHRSSSAASAVMRRA